jgi:hypothetical protein
MRSITRRNIVTTVIGAAGLSAIPVAATAMIPDPIYAAIERHKALNAAFRRALTGMGRFEKMNGWADSPERDVWREREIETCDAERGACDEMIATAPTTLAGLLALLRYVEKEKAEFLDEDALKELLSTTVSALASIGAVL